MSKYWGDASRQTARTLSGLASALLYEEKIDESKAAFERALASYRLSLGEDHPKVAETISNLGSVYYFSGDVAGAERYFRQALTVYRKVYGNGHPEVAIVLNNVARMELELGRVDDALPLLEESVGIDRNLGRGGHDDFVLGLSNLAIAYKSRGDLKRAESLLNEARNLADALNHRYWGPLLVDLADLYCRTDRASDGLTLLREAKDKITTSYPDDPWRMALLENVEGGCSTSGPSDHVERELVDSYAVIQSRWGRDGLFSREARQISICYDRAGRPDLARFYRTVPKRVIPTVPRQATLRRSPNVARPSSMSSSVDGSGT